MPDLSVFSPVNGQMVSLQQVPDPAFASAMLGDGVAVIPSAGEVVAPFDGVISSVHKSLHAIAIRRREIEVLIHVGVDTVGLQGEGFSVCVQTGQSVKCGDRLLTFDPDFIAKKAPSNWVIVVATAPDAACLQKTPLRHVQAGKDELFSLPMQNTAADAAAQTDTALFTSAPICVTHANGLHARPASKLAEEAKKYPFSIEIIFQGRKANVKSLVAVMGLSIPYGAEVQLSTDAPPQKAQTALQNLATLLQDGTEQTTQSVSPISEKNTAEQDFQGPLTVRALVACGGLARGKACLWHTQDIAFTEDAPADPQTERQRLEEAIIRAEEQFQQEINTATDKAAQEILQTHAQLLKDPFLLEQAELHLHNSKSASYSFNEAIRASIDVLKKTRNPFFMERIDDFKDIRRRVLLQLTQERPEPPQIEPGCILVAKELLPSDIAALDGKATGVLLAGGSPTSHVSILLRNMGMVALVNAGPSVLNVPPGTEILLNAYDAVAYLAPDQSQQQHFAALQTKDKQTREQDLICAGKPAQTQDGITIAVCGNAVSEREALAAHQNGADGLGLVRTEFLFFKGHTAPTIEQQTQLYQQITSALHTREVTLRTLDVGGDKPVPYMPLPAEENPILGLRGVRNYQRYHSIFREQIQAMLRVEPTQAVRIMLPMVSFVDEFLHYKQFIADEARKMGLKTLPKIGVMVEVPSAALCAEQLAQHADFLSIGTNDLTQYTLAIDRTHKTLCPQADALHPAVLKLMQFTCQGAAKYQRPVAVCGALAAETQAVPLLIGLGVNELAVEAHSIGRIKTLVRSLSKSSCTELAQHALTLNSAKQVRALIKTQLDI